jgi:hypothetical protein
MLLALTGWLERREREALAYLIEENCLLRRQLGGRRLRLTDDDRRRLAARAFRVGRRALREIAAIVTPAARSLETFHELIFTGSMGKSCSAANSDQ